MNNIIILSELSPAARLVSFHSAVSQLRAAAAAAFIHLSAFCRKDIQIDLTQYCCCNYCLLFFFSFFLLWKTIEI